MRGRTLVKDWFSPVRESRSCRATHLDAKNSQGLRYQLGGITPPPLRHVLYAHQKRCRVIIHSIGTIRSRLGSLPPLRIQLSGSTLGKMWVVTPPSGVFGLRYGLLPSETMSLSTSGTRPGRSIRGCSNTTGTKYPVESPGTKELACGSQAFIATLLFDPSMSALPIIAKQNSPSVGLFTH